jgi:hypothetical protein
MRCTKARAGRAEHQNLVGLAKIAMYKPARGRTRQRRPKTRSGYWSLENQPR